MIQSAILSLAAILFLVATVTWLSGLAHRKRNTEKAQHPLSLFLRSIFLWPAYVLRLLDAQGLIPVAAVFSWFLTYIMIWTINVDSVTNLFNQIVKGAFGPTKHPIPSAIVFFFAYCGTVIITAIWTVVAETLVSRFGSAKKRLHPQD